MGMMEEVGERAGVGAGWMIGAGIALVALAGPSLMKAMRPAAKAAIKGYMSARDRAREAVSESGERLQDVYEEAKHEYEESHEQREMAGGGEMTEEEAPARRESAEAREARETGAKGGWMPRRHRSSEGGA